MVSNSLPRTVILLTLALTLAAMPASAQEAGELAKKTQNPVGDLTSVPFQFNWSSGGDLGNRALYNLNFQPVFPLGINTKWNLIARPVIPILNIPVPGSEGPDGISDRATGIGDIQTQLFLTPKSPGSIIWGVGPVLSLPTATNDLARTGVFGMGPTAVLLAMPGKIVTGVLANQVWKVAGTEDSGDYSRAFIQPFFNYNLPNAWTIGTSPGITANWEAASGQEWTVPVGGGVSKVTAIGKQPFQLGMFYYHNAVKPDGAPEDTYRLNASFLFPIAKP